MNDSAWASRHRAPPGNLQAEQALLGAILSNNRAFERVADFLEPEHFVDPCNAAVYERARDVILEGGTADAVTLRAHFDETPILDPVGGVSYLVKLLTAMVSIKNAGDYGHAIRNAWVRRIIIDVCGEVVERAYSHEAAAAPEKLIDEVSMRLSDIGATGPRHVLMTVGEAVQQAIDHSERVYKGEIAPAIMCGISAIDYGLGGFYKRNLTIMAGIPGAGKTTLAVQAAYGIAQDIAADGQRRGLTAEQVLKLPGVAIFSLEMSGQELGERIAAWRAGVEISKILKGELDFVTTDALIRAQAEAAKLPLRIYDCAGMSLSLLGAKVRMHLRRQREVLVAIDHLLAMDEGDVKASRGAMPDVGRTVRSLRNIAREEDIAMLVLSHVKRGSRMRAESRPVLDDLKFGGEGDADAVCFVHRPVMFMSSSPPPAGSITPEKHAILVSDYYKAFYGTRDLAELVVEKARKNTRGVHKMKWIGSRTSFEEWPNE